MFRVKTEGAQSVCMLCMMEPLVLLLRRRPCLLRRLLRLVLVAVEMPNCICRKFYPFMQAKLSHDIADVGLNGILSDAEGIGYLTVCHTVCHKLENLYLSS